MEISAKEMKMNYENSKKASAKFFGLFINGECKGVITSEVRPSITAFGTSNFDYAFSVEVCEVTVSKVK